LDAKIATNSKAIETLSGEVTTKIANLSSDLDGRLASMDG
jgi:hypothetical protein